MDERKFINECGSRISNFCTMIRDNNCQQPGNIRPLVWYTPESKFVISTIDQLTEFNFIVNYIAFYRDFNGSFSTKYIEGKLAVILHKLLRDSTKVDECLEELYMSLIDDSSNEWFVVTRLENIALRKSCPFKLIDSTIKYMYQQDFFNENAIVLRKPENESENVILKRVLGPDISNWIQKPCIYTTVKAGDYVKAESLAFDNFNLSLNLLRLYLPNSNIAIKGKGKGAVSISDKREVITQDIISFNKTKERVNSSSNRNVVEDQVFSVELYEALENMGINNLSNNSEIKDVIKNCLYWYGLALDTTLLSAKLFNYVTVLESALKRSGEKDELTQRIADRCALFLETEFEKRKNVCKDIKEIYTLRSNVVHTGHIIGKKYVVKKPKEIIEDQRLTELAGTYARNILIKLIKNSNQWNSNFETFISEIDSLKYKYTHHFVRLPVYTDAFEEKP